MAHLRSTRRCFLLSVLATLTPRAVEADAGSGSRRVLYLQPLGRELPEKDVALVRESIAQFYDLEVKALPRIELPRAAYYAPRARYRAEKLLELLEKKLPAGGDRILGLTGVDISTTKGEIKDWGILGLANLNSTVCVISAFRCRMKAKGALHARMRLAKVAVHEVGHTLGLEHCETVGCLMEDARGLVKTCDREFDLCAECRRKIAASGRVIPAHPKIPWPRP
jgi:archaemetzincin